MIKLNEFISLIDTNIPNLNNDEIERTNSYAAYYRSTDTDPYLITVILLDDFYNIVNKFKFKNIESAEVFLEKYFNIDEIELADDDVSEFLYMIGESFDNINKKIERKVDMLKNSINANNINIEAMAYEFFTALKEILGGSKPSEQELKYAIERLKNLNKFSLSVSLFSLSMGIGILYFIERLARAYDFSIYKQELNILINENNYFTHEGKMITEVFDNIKSLSYKGFGISRADMPQLDEKNTKKLIQYLSNNYEILRTKLPVNILQMSQNDIDKNKIDMNVDYDRVIILSKDYFILDGHHYVVSLYNKDPESEINVIIVDLDFIELYSITKDFIQ